VITEEVSGTENLKNLILNWQNKATKAIQKHSMNIDGLEKTIKLTSLIYC
jgi:hypothetical protein